MFDDEGRELAEAPEVPDGTGEAGTGLWPCPA